MGRESSRRITQPSDGQPKIDYFTLKLGGVQKVQLDLYDTPCCKGHANRRVELEGYQKILLAILGYTNWV